MDCTRTPYHAMNSITNFHLDTDKKLQKSIYHRLSHSNGYRAKTTSASYI